MKYGSLTYCSYALSLLLFSGMILYWTGSSLLIQALLGLVLLLLIPFTGNLITSFWKRTTIQIGKINGIILLSFIFFLLVVPIGIIRRLAGSDVLLLKKNKRAKSYYKIHDRPFDCSDIEQIW